MRLIEYTGSKIKSKFIKPENLLYEQRTQIFLRSSQKVKVMLENIKKQKKESS